MNLWKFIYLKLFKKNDLLEDLLQEKNVGRTIIVKIA